ncbi:MAG: terminase family protein [Nocardiaceae bacterium]|nr:terminase family protein [Nocardiaceae bacterium]
MDSVAFVQVIRGPLGSGKTTCSAAKLFKLICDQRPTKEGIRKSRYAAVRNTYPDLKNTTIRDWRSVVPDNCGRFTMGVPPEHKLDFDLPDGTRVVSEVIFLALDRPDDVRKLRGMQLTGAWINEMKELPKAILDMITGRVDRYPAPGFSNWVGILGDTNAWDDDHWLEELDRLRIKGELPGYEFFVQPPAVMKIDGRWMVNPLAENLKVLKPDYYQRQIAGKRDAWIKVNLENRIGISFDGKPVHPDYDDTVHVAPDILRPVPGVVFVGMDFGLSPAAAFFQLQPNGQWFGLEEVVCTDMGAVRFADAVKRKVAEMKQIVPGLTFIFRGDPAGDERVGTDESTVFQTLRLNGIPAQPCSTNDPALRRDALDRPLTRIALGKPGLLISPTMKVFRRGMAGGYCYKRIEVPGTEKFRDVPDKNEFSHVVEAGEYALLDAGEHATRNSPGAQILAAQGAVTPTSNWNPLDA